MNQPSDTAPSRSTEKARSARAWAPFVLTPLLIWLGWQIAVALLVQRAPAAIAVQVAPASGWALGRAAEAELVAKRPDQAHDLAILSLRQAPFNVRALRVLGLSTARTDEASADEMLTLAGNWSLRDDPSHTWLISRRLRLGDYVGAFGHADTLARRRKDLRPVLFNLFTTAATSDRRSIPALLARLADQPDWRFDYLNSLQKAKGGLEVQATIALGLQGHEGRLSDAELEHIYSDWWRDGHYVELAALRRQLNRPPPAALHDGGFEDAPAPQPFRWILGQGPGLLTEISARPDDSSNKALFVETDGFSPNAPASQLLYLQPGAKRFTASYRFEAGGRTPSLEWTVTCVSGQQPIARWRPAPGQDVSGWQSEVMDFVVPEGCGAQWLELRNLRGTRRGTVVAWFDSLSIGAALGAREN